MKKLVFITTRLFWPTDSGRKVSLYYYCKGLHEVYGYDIYIYSFLEGGQTEDLLTSKPNFVKEVLIASPIKKNKKILNLINRSLFCGWTFQSALYYSKENGNMLQNYCLQVNPDLILVDMIRLAPYYAFLKRFNCPKVLDMDDLLSKRYLRQAQSSYKKGSLLGAYCSTVSRKSNKIINQSFLRKIILKSESKRARKAEFKYAGLYDKVIFVSSTETNYLNQALKTEKAVTVTMGVDYDYYSENLNLAKEKGALGFLGNMKVAANVDSLHIIADEILPKLNSDYKLYVVGTCPEEIKKQFSNDKIVFCGMVDDVRKIIARCEVFISPISYGSGIKTKILEAMAMGIPVVTNSIGIEGIVGENGTHFLVSDSIEDLVYYVNTLLADPEYAKAVSDHSKELVKNVYNWTAVYSSLSEVCNV